MVLQNKYKAKASRRYNNQHAATDDAESGSSKPGYRHRFVKKHGHSSSQNGRNGAVNGAVSGSEESEDDDDGDDSASGSASGSEQEDGNADFPSLSKAAATSDKSQTLETDQDPSNPSRGKYARRKLGESKLARLERLEAAKDPRLPDDEEPEPEVDISNLVARVAALGDSAGTQAGVAEELARSRGQHETASDVENDIDHSLAYLHEKERLRQKAKGRGGAHEGGNKVASEALIVDAEGNAIDLDALQKEKEKADALRALKVRFQGHGVGERARQDGRSRAAPSIQIGRHAASNKPQPPNDAQTSSNGTLSDSIAAEIESSLEKTRNGSANGETASTHSGRSSFSTTFGRRKSPLSGPPKPEQWERASAGSAGPSPPSANRTERIDSFLASLNDRAVAGKDPTVFSLSSCGSNGRHTQSQQTDSPNRSDRTLVPNSFQHHHHPPQTPIHSTPGELGRLESFLDDMLG
ncbi:hypothetical protein PHSY_006972 [Pseudozyma hubeiensis SY62]|uniref:Uncharacterized protein n=1 Tax=Pseudozyma hubeiensis (strain SY62) TaxID=1305764 RepID=R9PDF5_PSEHS|nr:hypothetical protein PHSY_006972 [Pseudozyma hubeiensis SY62]GAC99371.1 hypothetical protein PHSY_006972 [Pseudozyma hubeiensis SY62]